MEMEMKMEMEGKENIFGQRGNSVPCGSSCSEQISAFSVCIIKAFSLTSIIDKKTG